MRCSASSFLIAEEVLLEGDVLLRGRPRRRVPAMGRTVTRRPSTRTIVSGEEPKRAVSPHSR
jgi:hypothetical protein